MVKVLIADNNFLTRTGLELLLGEIRGIELLPTVCGAWKNLREQTRISHPDLILINLSSFNVSIQELQEYIRKFSSARVIVISELQDKPFYESLLEYDTAGLLLHECDKPEILDCIHSVLFEKKRFICGKILALLSHEPEISNVRAHVKKISCNGHTFSKRECDIIREIALGYSNKEIASHLNISVHTVATHRKKILAKLGTGNTAGIVLFAVRNQLIPSSYI
jgi:DNA-binding NarL/FixJ family response regulator